MQVNSAYLNLLKNRINLRQIPFSERGSRLLVFRAESRFSIRLAERWIKQSLDLTTYRDRRPLIATLQLTDGDGRPLEFLLLTTYPHRIDCQTAVGLFTLTFVDSETLLLGLPPAACGLTFQAYLDHCQTDRRGGVLRLTGDIRRNIAYTTNARLLENTATPWGVDGHQVQMRMADLGQGRAVLLNITPRLGFNRWVPEPAIALEAAERRWHDWFSAAPVVADELRTQYYYAWWVMRAGLISSRYYMTRESMTPSKIQYVGVWQWDAYFHALAYRHVDMHLAKDQLRVVLDHQREDGMIPDAVHDEGTVTRMTYPVEADVTKPPLLAWSAWKLYEADGDREFLDEIYEPIVRWNNWWFTKNDVDHNGLCEYQHPYSSGLDDSPLWDSGMPVESPDLNTYLCLQESALANIAATLGDQTAADYWMKRAVALAQQMLALMWDSQAGLFWASRKGQPIHVRTPFNLFPLLTGYMPPDIAARLVAHLTDEHSFWSRYPVPTVALNDRHYSPETMWRGPTWVNVNYLLIEGLEKSGHHAVARDLRHRTLEMMCALTDIYEYYHPDTGQAPPKAAPIFGWSSALFIEMAIQASQLEKQK